MRGFDGRLRLRRRFDLGSGLLVGGLLIRRLLASRLLLRRGLGLCGLLRGRLAFAVDFNQRLPDFQVIAFAHEQAGDFPGGRCRNRHGRLVSFELDQRLALRHLIALLDQDLDDVAPFDAFREKRQFDFHGFTMVLPSLLVSIFQGGRLSLKRERVHLCSWQFLFKLYKWSFQARSYPLRGGAGLISYCGLSHPPTLRTSRRALCPTTSTDYM